MTERRSRARARWVALFGILFVLSLDVWAWDGSVRFGPLQLPLWIFYFIGLQFALAAAVHRFATTYWPDDDADGNDAA